MQGLPSLWKYGLSCFLQRAISFASVPSVRSDQSVNRGSITPTPLTRYGLRRLYGFPERWSSHRLLAFPDEFQPKSGEHFCRKLHFCSMPEFSTEKSHLRSFTFRQAGCFNFARIVRTAPQPTEIPMMTKTNGSIPAHAHHGIARDTTDSAGSS